MLKDRYICGQCGYNFDLAIGGFHTADVKTHCDKVMRVERVNVREPREPLEEKDAEIARLHARIAALEQAARTYLINSTPVNAVALDKALKQAKGERDG